jgi:hypothetical protein
VNGPESYKRAAHVAEHVFEMRVEETGDIPIPKPVHDHEERIELLLHALVCAVQANTVAVMDQAWPIEKRSADWSEALS